MNLDWKYWLVALLTLAGILVPIGIWKMESDGKSLTVRMESSFSLKSVDSETIPNLEITIDGEKIESPFLSVVELSYEGDKPIMARDFETPIGLFIEGDAKIIRAKQLKSFPDGITANVEVHDKEISIQPMLLNPKDRVKIAILTSGLLKQFSPKSRIAGISEIKYVDDSTYLFSSSYILMHVTTALTSLFLYSLFGSRTYKNSNPISKNSVLLPSMFCFAMLSAMSASRLNWALRVNYNVDLQKSIYFISPVAVAILFSTFRFLDKKNKRNNEAVSSAQNRQAA